MSQIIRLPINQNSLHSFQLTPHVLIVPVFSNGKMRDAEERFYNKGTKIFHCLNMDVPYVNGVKKDKEIKQLALYLVYAGDFPKREQAETVAPVMLSGLYEAYKKHTGVEVPIRKQIEISEELVLAFEHAWKEESKYKIFEHYSDPRFVKNNVYGLKFISNKVVRHDDQTAGIHFPTFSVSYKFTLSNTHKKNQKYPKREILQEDIRLSSNNAPIYESEYSLSLEEEHGSFVLQVARTVMYDNSPYHAEQKVMVNQLLKQIKEDPKVKKMIENRTFFDSERFVLSQLTPYVKHQFESKTIELLKDFLFKSV